MCGRTFCAIDPHCIQKACKYIDPVTGRYITPEWKDAPTGENYQPSYNIGPTIFTPVLVSSTHLSAADTQTSRVIQPMRWGLIPPWHKAGRSAFKQMHNNCRGETISEKNTFSVPFNKGKRCVVIAEGFYEWKTDGKKKTPLLFTMKSEEVGPGDIQTTKFEAKQEIRVKSEPELEAKSDHDLENRRTIVKSTIKEENSSDSASVKLEKTESEKSDDVKIESENSKNITSKIDESKYESSRPGVYTGENGQQSSLIFMAAIFDTCKEEGGVLYSYSVLTTSAVGAVEVIHHRMPVILETEEDIERWLNYKDYPSPKVKDLIVPRDCLRSYSVSDKVNNVRYQEPDCVIEASQQDIKPKPIMKNDLRNWFTKKEPSSAGAKRKSEDNSSTPAYKKTK